MTTDDLARTAITDCQTAGTDYAAAVHREMILEHERPGRKAAAIRRIMASGDNPLTAKPHSASSAEAVAETDHEYAAHLAELRDVVLQKQLAWSNLTVARLNAELAIALVRAEAAV